MTRKSKKKNLFKGGRKLTLDTFHSFSNDHSRHLLDQSHDSSNAAKVNATIYLECHKKTSISDKIIINLISEFLDGSDFLSECEERDKKEIDGIRAEKNHLIQEMKKDAEYQDERFNLRKALSEIDRILGQ
jgi:flagellar motor component MotA